MRILGIDYGEKKIGLAVAEAGLAFPLRVILVNSITDAVEKIANIVDKENINKIVVGLSEGKTAKKTMSFVKALRFKLRFIPCEVFDETLTSQDAIRLSLEANVSNKKRKKMEDAFAASIILQNFLDSHS